MNMNTLRAANFARDQEWNTGSERVSMTFRATELAGEVGEACNVIKKLERERIGLVGSRDTKEHLAEELADIVICTDLVAMDAGIDLNAAITAKFNATSEKNGLLTRLSSSAPASLRPANMDPAMLELLEKAVAAFNSIPPNQRRKLREEQRQSWVQGEAAIAKFDRDRLLNAYEVVKTSRLTPDQHAAFNEIIDAFVDFMERTLCEVRS
ncbi:MazG-like family protein [Brucella tritici]|uniref:Uncharacterized protein n=1 Tax=Brucella tritici TaxID=94626 RepID=A0A6L3Y998_9HYPH|nr:MazG-like family protein [Brucella tritici]KAB2680525.1 hypothetical protein F9L08_20970 [Brucella tritici]